jgi:hypothetical protein
MSTGKSKGIALLEALLGATIALPIALSALVTMAFVHDSGAVQPIPETILAGQLDSVMSWIPDPAGSGIRVDTRSIEGELDRFAAQGVAAVTVNALRLKKVSAKACYWVHRVNPFSGEVAKEHTTGCRTEGELGADLNLDREHAMQLTHARGIPLLAGDSEAGFLGEVVLWGVAVGGEFNGLPLLFDGALVARAAVEVPRREVTL